MHAIGFRAPAEFFQMPIEALELSEEAHVEAEAVEQANRIMRVGSRDDAVAGIGDRLEMARRDETGDAGDREVSWRRSDHAFPFTAAAIEGRPAAEPSTAARRGAVTRKEYRSSIVSRPAFAMLARSG